MNQTNGHQNLKQNLNWLKIPMMAHFGFQQTTSKITLTLLKFANSTIIMSSFTSIKKKKIQNTICSKWNSQKMACKQSQFLKKTKDFLNQARTTNIVTREFIQPNRRMQKIDQKVSNIFIASFIGLIEITTQNSLMQRREYIWFTLNLTGTGQSKETRKEALISLTMELV